MAKAHWSELAAIGGYQSKNTPPSALPKVAPGPAPGAKPKEDTMMVVTCKKCRAWYSMDYELPIYDDHFDMRTGQPCNNEYEWDIQEVPYREDWRYAR